VCVHSICDILACHDVIAQEQSSSFFVHYVNALLRLIFVKACATCSCTTKGHPGPLSFKQGLCIYGDCDRFHAMDASLSPL